MIEGEGPGGWGKRGSSQRTTSLPRLLGSAESVDDSDVVYRAINGPVLTAAAGHPEALGGPHTEGPCLGCFASAPAETWCRLWEFRSGAGQEGPGTRAIVERAARHGGSSAGRRLRWATPTRSSRRKLKPDTLGPMPDNVLVLPTWPTTRGLTDCLRENTRHPVPAPQMLRAM